MGQRQRKNRFIYRACLVIFYFCALATKAQKGYLESKIQNGFYYEMSEWDKEKHLIIGPNSISNCDSLIGILKSTFLKESQNDTTAKIWKLSSYFSFDYEDGIYSFAKIQKMKDTIILGHKTFGFFKKEACWVERQIPELSSILSAIHSLRPDTFWAFYNSEPSGIAEIDKIKVQFKDPNGTLNLHKLGNYLATKPKELAQWMDW